MRLRGGVLLLIPALVLAGTACGGDDDDSGGALSPEEQEVVDAVFAELEATNANGFGAVEANRRCYAETIVETYGIEAIEAEGLTAVQLADPDVGAGALAGERAEQFVSVMATCNLFDEFTSGVFAADAETPAGFAVRESTTECITDKFGDEGTQAVLARILSTPVDDPARTNDDATLTRVMLDCGFYADVFISEFAVTPTADEIDCLDDAIAANPAMKDVLADDAELEAAVPGFIDSLRLCIPEARLAEIFGV